MGILKRIMGKETPEEKQARFERNEGKRVLREYRQEDLRQSTVGRIASRIAQSQQYANQPRRLATQERVSQISREVTGRGLPTKYQGKKGYAGRGRPRGPSGTYIIPGKGAVGVYEWRKWARQQRRLQQLQQTQQLSEQLAQNPNAYQGRIKYAQPQPPAQQISQPRQISQPLLQPGITLAGGWDLLKVGTPGQQQPKINLNNGMKVFQVQSPVTNPQGDWYTQPDFLTGRQVLRRRGMEGGFGLW